MLAKEIGFWPAPWWDVVHAELLYREAVALIHGSPAPEDARLLILRGRSLGAILRFDAAIGGAQQGHRVKTGGLGGLVRQGVVLFHQQQWKQAVADFTRAIELDPKVQQNWWHRGHCYLNLAEWDKAAADFGNVVDQSPEAGEAWYRRTLALAQLSQPEKALADLRQAITRGFTNLELMKTDSRLDPLRTREDFQKVLTELERKEK